MNKQRFYGKKNIKKGKNEEEWNRKRSSFFKAVLEIQPFIHLMKITNKPILFKLK